MSNPLQLLEDYPALTRAERAEADRVLAARPDLADAYAEARALAALLDDVASGADAGLHGDALTEHVAETMAGRPGNPALAQALAHDAALRAEADARREALLRLDAAEDPIARFERLTGRTPGSLAAPPAGARAVPPACAQRKPRPAETRPAITRGRARRTPGWLRLASLAVVACALAWSALAVASRAALPERARVADLGDVAGYALPTLRGDSPEDALMRYHALAAEVAAARRTTLGLFPRYDAEALAPLEGRMAALAAEAPAGSDAQQEAGLAAARIALYLGRDDAARRHTEALVATGGYRSPVARRLLDYVASGTDEAP
ncbi:MAG: hypothetical protein ACK41D_02880 [Rubricoccaceae bacterium]